MKLIVSILRILSKNLLQESLEVALEEGQKDGGRKAGGHQVQQGRLGMLKHMHHKDGHQQPSKVGSKGHLEVSVGTTFQAAEITQIIMQCKSLLQENTIV